MVKSWLLRHQIATVVIVTAFLASSTALMAAVLTEDQRAINEAGVGPCPDGTDSCVDPAQVRRDEAASALRRLGGLGSLRFVCATARSSPHSYPDIHRFCSTSAVRTVDPSYIFSFDAPAPPPRPISVATGWDGNSVMSYISDKALGVVHCRDPECSQTTKAVLDTVGPGVNQNNSSSSIAIGNDGNPIISYNIASSAIASLKTVHCKTPSCSLFDPPTVLEESDPAVCGVSSDQDCAPGIGNSIAIVKDGKPVLSYFNSQGLQVLFCGDAACTVAAPQQPPSLETGAGPTSIVVGGDNDPLVLYPGGLAKVTCTQNPPECSASDAPFDIPQSLGNPRALTLGHDGFPTIVSVADRAKGEETFKTLAILDCSQSGCVQKVLGEPVEVDAGAGGTLSDVSVAVGMEGFPVIGYGSIVFADSAKTMKLLLCKNPGCSRAQLVNVDGGGAAHAVAVRPDGVPSVAYSGANPASSGAGLGLKIARPALSGVDVALGVPVLEVRKAGSGSGTVKSKPAGIDCGDDCTQEYPVQAQNPTQVELTAEANSGSAFTGWRGACTGANPTCTVTMDQSRDVAATFDRIPRTLTVTRSGPGSVTSTPAGIDCGTTCNHDFLHGDEVTLQAAPADNFSGWGGACAGASPTCTVKMDKNQNVTANFVQLRGLTVAKAGSGSGEVTSSPAGIDCGTDCSHSYEDGKEVTLSAEPVSGSAFSGWSGDCTGTGACTLKMNAPKSVTAVFDRIKHGLAVTKSGAGAGSVTSSPAGINCGTDCAESYPEGDEVDLTAAVGENSTFAGWSGDCTGTALTCKVEMDAAKQVTATFAKVRRALTVSKAGTGSGSVTSSPEGINCGGDCSQSYPHGDQVTLSAKPASGSAFSGWSAPCTGTGTCTLTMDGAKTVTATFTSQTSQGRASGNETGDTGGAENDAGGTTGGTAGGGTTSGGTSAGQATGGTSQTQNVKRAPSIEGATPPLPPASQPPFVGPAPPPNPLANGPVPPSDVTVPNERIEARPHDEATQSGGRGRAPWIVLGLLLVMGGFVLYWFRFRRPATDPFISEEEEEEDYEPPGTWYR